MATGNALLDQILSQANPALRKTIEDYQNQLSGIQKSGGSFITDEKLEELVEKKLAERDQKRIAEEEAKKQLVLVSILSRIIPESMQHEIIENQQAAHGLLASDDLKSIGEMFSESWGKFSGK
jgi:hypothetical protein